MWFSPVSLSVVVVVVVIIAATSSSAEKITVSRRTGGDFRTVIRSRARAAVREREREAEYSRSVEVRQQSPIVYKEARRGNVYVVKPAASTVDGDFDFQPSKSVRRVVKVSPPKLYSRQPIATYVLPQKVVVKPDEPSEPVLSIVREQPPIVHSRTADSSFQFFADEVTVLVKPQYDCHRKRSGNYPASLCANFFWRCEAGNETRVACPADDLFYSPEIDDCVPKDAAPGCRHMQRMLPEDKPCAKHGPAFPAGFYPDPEGDCNKYVFCAAGNLYSVNCREGEVYDDGRGRCAKPDEVVGYCGTAKLVPFTCDDRHDGYYRSQADCGVYYKCDRHRVSAMVCPFFFAFDFRTKTCRPSSSVPGCSLPGDLSAGERFCRTLQRDDVYPDPSNCHQSIVCSRDMAYVFLCAEPGRTAYDPEKRSCVAYYDGCGKKDED